MSTIRECVIAAAVTITAAAATTSTHAADVTLRLAHVAPATSAYQTFAERFSEHLNELSAGTMAVQIIPGGALGNLVETWAQLRAGSLDMHMVDLSALSAIEEAREFMLLWAPYLFRNHEHMHKFLESQTFAEMMGAAEQKIGIKYVGYLGDRPGRALTTDDTLVKTPDDLKGLKIRTPLTPMITRTFEAWGAAPTPVKASALYTALQTGLVDGQDNDIIEVVASGYDEVQDYYMPINYIYSGIGIWMSGPKWGSLTDQQQNWVFAASNAAFADAQEALPKELEEAYAAAKDKGITVVEDVDIEAFRKAARPVIDSMDGELWPAGLYDEIQQIH